MIIRKPAVRARSVLKLFFLVAAIVSAGGACATTSHGPTAATAGNEVAGEKAPALNRLYDEYWEEVLQLNPLQATFQGDPRYNDQLPDFGAAVFRQQSHQFTQRWLERIETIGPDGLQGQDLLSYQIFVRDAKNTLEYDEYPACMQPVNQMINIASFAAQLGSGTGAQPFKTVKDYDNWLARGVRLPVLLDTDIDNMRHGIKAGVVQPKALMTKVLPQLDALIKDKSEDTLFWGPITSMPAGFRAADKTRLTTAYREMIGGKIMPAYRKLRTFLAEEYLPSTRATYGLDKLPHGARWYAYSVRSSTTTDMSPEQIHQLGLAEVARIHGAISKLMTEVGFKGDLQGFFKFMRTDTRFTYKTEADLLEHYRGLETQINQRIREQFVLTRIIHQHA